MRKRILSYLQYVFFLGLGIFLVWWQLKSMSDNEKQEFYSALKHVNYWIIIPIATMSLLSHISRSMRWKLMMEPLGFKPRLINLFSATMVGYLANAAIPRLGEIIKCSLLAKYEQLKVDKLVGTIIVERSFDFICYILIIIITFLIQIDTLASYIKNQFNAFSSVSHTNFALKITIVLLTALAVWIIIKKIIKSKQSNKLLNKIVHFFKGIVEGFQSIRKLKQRRAFIFHTIFIWSMYLGQIYLGFKGMEGIHSLGLLPAFSVLTLTTLSMIITPGGIGSFPIFVMQTLLIYGINANLGRAFGWLMWGVSTGIIVIVGFISLVIMPYLNKNHPLKVENS